MPATRKLHWKLVLGTGLGLLLLAGQGRAEDALLGSILEEPGSAGLGFLVRAESSP